MMIQLALSDKQKCWIGVAIVFVLASLTYAVRPISDNDFFWHLKTGEWIWQHGHLPDYDPFTFTGPQSPNSAQMFILRGYPLSQLLYYGFYSAGGWVGFFLLRVVMVAAFFVMLMLRFSLNEIHRHSWLFVCSLLMLFCALLLECYPLDRPAAISYIFFSILLLLYDWVVIKGYQQKAVWVMVSGFALTSLWGNFHAGVLVALATLVTIIVAETILFFLKRRDKKQLFAVLVLVVSGITGCFFNNAGVDFQIIKNILLSAKSNFVYNDEYLSLYEYYKIYNDINIVYYCLYVLFVAFIFLFYRPLSRLGDIFILIFTGIYSFFHVRYIPFFVIASIPFLFCSLKLFYINQKIRYIIISVSLVFFLYAIVDEVKNIEKLNQQGPISSLLPEKAADFVISSNLQGNIFNSYNWGGYLLWRFFPERKVYQDGRGLNNQVVFDWLSTMISIRGGDGRPLWQNILDKYEIRVAILPKFKENSSVIQHPLTLEMYSDPQWEVLYSDPISIVFQRKFNSQQQ